MEKFEFNLMPDASSELIIRNGEAKKVYDPEKVTVKGNIDTPTKWLAKKIGTIIQTICHIYVSIENRSITLVINEADKFSSVITGVIELHPNFTKWGINDPSKSYSSHELAQAVKMNRYMFSSSETAMKLVTTFQNFKAKVEKEIELSDDKRGNRSNVQRQVVSNMTIPLNFSIKVPIFKGSEPIEMPIEIEINADTLQCSLFSPLANDIINTTAESMINEQLILINEIAPDIAVISG
jgi:hypothetical protein